MRRPVQTHTFSGVSFAILIGEFDGITDTPAGPVSLVVNRSLDEQIGLETLIHEGLHACRPYMRESTIAPVAHDIARFLWRLGYRVQK